MSYSLSRVRESPQRIIIEKQKGYNQNGELYTVIPSIVPKLQSGALLKWTINSFDPDC